MKMLMRNTALATSIALAMLIAAETAGAQEYLSHEAAYAQGHHAAHATTQRDAVMSGQHRIGSDPDSFIRGEILRHSDSGWPD
jgi:hypothetical protein